MTLLSDPNIAFLLFVVGLAGILVELVHPTVLGGILGALCLILAFVGFGSLPLNVAGLVLLAFGMVLFALESQFTTNGILAVAGLVAFVIGASILYTVPAGTPVPAPAVATPVIVVAAAAFALFMGAVAFAAIRVRHMAFPGGTVGTVVPVGTVGVVQAPLAPQGTVHLGGETWSARTADGQVLDRDARVRLVSFDGLIAVVVPEAAPPPAAQRPPAPPIAASQPGIRQ
jgi:membrane-bound serine protease (ClpP class)